MPRDDFRPLHDFRPSDLAFDHGPDDAADDPSSPAIFAAFDDERAEDEDEPDEDEQDDDEQDDGTDPEDAALLDEAFPLGDGVAAGVAEVWCPYCGEPNEIVLDPGGGEAQEYVEDCQVCCQPWRVHVTYLSDGSAAVTADADDGR